MPDNSDTRVSDLIHRTVVDSTGDKIGTVFDVYVDDATSQPEWLAVTTGWFGTKVSFVPLVGVTTDGGDVVVPHSKDTVKDAPRADADGSLSVEEENALYTHYGRTGHVDRATGETKVRARGRDTSDDAMTRSEEQLDVSTRTRQAGKARLRKWIETEDVHMTVPVKREKARVVVEPITDANRADALAGETLTSSEHEITLSEEVVDVSKQVVPKERVRLETDVETDQVAVDEKVRKERIQIESDNPRTR